MLVDNCIGWQPFSDFSGPTSLEMTLIERTPVGVCSLRHGVGPAIAIMETFDALRLEGAT